MQRSKQRALTFLVGAVLVGGILGFSAYPYLRHQRQPGWGARDAFYADLGLSAAQRQKIDSMLDVSNHQTDSLFAPVKRAADSLREASKKQIEAIMTPAQRTLMDQRIKEFQKKNQAHRDSIAKAHGQQPGGDHGGRPPLPLL